MNHSRCRRSALAALLGLALGTAQAQFKDAQLQSLLDSGKTLELERVAQARLAAKAGDAEAIAALGLVAMNLGEEKKIDVAVNRLEQCTGKQSPSALCHYVLGSLAGTQAMNASVFRMPSLAGKSRDNLKRAVELDPQLYEAREALLQYYLMAPGIVGGGVDKAQTLIAESEKLNPEHAKFLRAKQASADKQWAVVERELAAVKPGQDLELRKMLRKSWSQLGAAQLSAKQADSARATFERLQHDFPEHAAGPYGLARVLTEQNKPDEALALLERARGLEGGATYPIDYRLGLAWLAKGDKAQARAALQRYVADKSANARNLEDAKKRLAELG
ncbi:tetratricopeptide repeat protein [Pelomonas sp. V22]|uniref:tetratricopeptide repeat protein n=1 Tax=Pelomonas sp. V22 TaxID=2822139 RepID=UPI0024A7B732|nr:tetratricopeptide repeat protein [Pelomonas sp. V22]MDI4631962.1 tetratricopeptide repeat protein [Pelomonas sp. V22]